MAALMHQADVLFSGQGWKTIDELVIHESKIMAVASLNELDPQHIHDLFVQSL